MHPRSETDQALVLRVGQGDPDALDEIYGRYARSVYGLAYRILGEPSAAEDVVQDVFLKLWRQPASYNPERGSLGSWLLGVGHNRAIDVLRRRRTHLEHPLP